MVVVRNNTASSGGGILLRECELIIRSPLTVSDNKAEAFGGGVYAYQSIIDFASDQTNNESLIINNIAGQSGGGMFIVASSIKLSQSYVSVSSNTALLSGGGLYLESNSKIYLYKHEEDFSVERANRKTIQFKVTENSAVFGGGIFVADNSTAGSSQCQQFEKRSDDNEALISPECFIQTIKTNYFSTTSQKLITQIINNTAISGSALYGGLLDRCTLSPLAELYDAESNEEINGLQYVKRSVMISNHSISSDPVQVVLCDKQIIIVKKGEAFKVGVSAIDQDGNLVNATIHSSVITESGVGRLKEGQMEQSVENQCTEIEYNVFSRDSSAQVELYADGPCFNLGISKQTFGVSFLPCTCPIGFQPSQSQVACECVCDQTLQQHKITNCSQLYETIQIETNIWMWVANSNHGPRYLIHNCPFDYCASKPVNISLNNFQDRDKQCAYNRSGFLCGECQQGLSLVLATSKCKKCSNTHLFLLIPFALAGIALTVLILFFNITLATGTVHGLIFYSNLLPTSYFTSPNPLTVFVSWVNLDFGIETCFYNGMNSQAKVLLQLVFPTYLFLLIFLIIILSRYSNFFATLLSNRNPVAALCTLIFLAYSKLLRFIIAALQSTVLEYPSRRVWFFDANVQYFTANHIPQVVAAVLILIAGGLFTLQLFFAQWFPRCYKWKFMKWTRYTKYTGFMDTYHAPFTHKHRYWVGLLLFTLIVHNVVAAVATDNFLPVLSVGCIAIGIILLKLINRRIYKVWSTDFIENVFLLNLVILAFGTLYARSAEMENVIGTLASISMGISTCLFLMIICYHTYKFVYLQSRFYRRHGPHLKETAIKIKRKLRREVRQDTIEFATEKGDTSTQRISNISHQRREPDLDLLVPITNDDYRPASQPYKVYQEVTHTVVEVTHEAQI